LNSGVPREAIAGAILTSPEYRGDLVTAWFQEFLGRSPTPEEVNSYTTALAAGARDQAMIAFILSTPEFISRANAGIACYCRGTLIETPLGEMPVEELHIGDEVMTVSGMAKAVRWIGRRSYSDRFIAGNRAVLPIRIAAGALADGMPRHDLYVS